ncbi:hypothetical protein B0I35DRAFT_459425 [Stachybotrys elegans]|uniref:Rhodopsin domain-containing protein n=1 Tax=Stachybotrys elegans TaxID=80388 RepID=A0A8K0WRW5_9HYPO|nr:hypothetical protein B0I35DRAFT_459425 [Stachybotrys elegans]
MSAPLPPGPDRPRISDDNLSPVVQIVSWLCLTFSIIFVISQFLTKWTLSRRPNVADGLLLLSLIFASAQTAALVSDPGKHIGASPEGIADGTVQRSFQALYASELLSVLTLATVKASLILSLLDITPARGHRIAIAITGGLVSAWMVSSIFIIAFQCPAPDRWDVRNRQCTNIIMGRSYIGIMNMLTDVILIALPTVIVLPLNVRIGQRITILCAFWARIIVLVATIIYLVALQRLDLGNSFTIDVWVVVVCKQAIQATSIMAACVPFLRPVLLSLESGFLRVDDANRRTVGNSYGTAGQSDMSSRGPSNYIKLHDRYGSQQKGIELQPSTTQTTQSG